MNVSEVVSLEHRKVFAESLVFHREFNFGVTYINLNVFPRFE